MKYILTALVCLILAGCVTTDSDTISGWSFRKDNLSSKGHGFNVVSKENGHPVRSGEKSLRFEVRPGDCGSSKSWSDCSTDRERNEQTEMNAHHSGETWYHWSLYLPEDFKSAYPALTYMGQFHSKGSRRPSFMFKDERGIYRVKNFIARYMLENEVIKISQMTGKWTDVLLHVNWTRGQDGFFRVYFNGNVVPAYYYSGPTRPPWFNEGAYFKFGIYRYKVSLHKWEVPTQVVYYDDVRKGKSCSDVTSYFDCSKLMESERIK